MTLTRAGLTTVVRARLVRTRTHWCVFAQGSTFEGGRMFEVVFVDAGQVHRGANALCSVVRSVVGSAVGRMARAIRLRRCASRNDSCRYGHSRRLSGLQLQPDH
jgi:hypothetical protein